MYILQIKNLTKEDLVNKNAHYDAQLNDECSISPKEMNNICNKLLEGIPVFLKGCQIKSHCTPANRYEYRSITITDPEQIPGSIKTYAKESKCSLMQAVVEYNKLIQKKVSDYINRRTKYIKNLEVRNKIYKEIMHACDDAKIESYSPCAKTRYEVTAENNFMAMLPKDCNITEEQIAYVKCNAPKWGLEIPTTEFYTASREAFKPQYDDYGNYIGSKSHGYTEEIQLVGQTRPNYFAEHFGIKDAKNYKAALHPNNVPEDWMVHSLGTTSGQYKQVLDMIRYFESLPIEEQDNFIGEGYKRCPHCGQIVRAHQDPNDDDYRLICDNCGEDIEDLDIITVSNEHLLYGTDIDQVYSSLEDINAYLDNQEEEDYND